MNKEDEEWTEDSNWCPLCNEHYSECECDNKN